MAEPADSGLGYLAQFGRSPRSGGAHEDGRHKLHGYRDRPPIRAHGRFSRRQRRVSPDRSAARRGAVVPRGRRDSRDARTPMASSPRCRIARPTGSAGWASNASSASRSSCTTASASPPPSSAALSWARVASPLNTRLAARGLGVLPGRLPREGRRRGRASGRLSRPRRSQQARRRVRERLCRDTRRGSVTPEPVGRATPWPSGFTPRGTTGTPKAAVHCHRDACSRAITMPMACWPSGLGTGSFATSKLFFAYALGNALADPALRARQLHLHPAWPDPRARARTCCATIGPRSFFSVPTVYARLLRAGAAHGRLPLGEALRVGGETAARRGLPRLARALRRRDPGRDRRDRRRSSCSSRTGRAGAARAHRARLAGRRGCELLDAQAIPL